MRHLAHMAEAKRKDEWDRQSQLLAMIHNVTATTKKSASEFNPYGSDKRSVPLDAKGLASVIGKDKR